MACHLRYLTAVSIVSVALTSFVARSEGLPFEIVKTPPVPVEIQVPKGHVAVVKAHAVGTQNYVCRYTGSNVAWTLFGPQATLFVTLKWIGGDISQQVMTHFLSPNPAENGLPRATWMSSLDTSAVWARAIASSTDPNYVKPDAIAWLLLEIVGRQRGPSGGAMLSPVTFIQRLNTSGGVAPASGCSEPGHAGNTVLVPYATDYYFYRANGRK